MYEGFAGKTVILTREAPDNAELASRLRGHALETVELPCVRTEPLADPRELDAALSALCQQDWVVVTSRHGADGVARCAPTRARVAAVGNATADRLRSHGLGAAFQPSRPHGAALARELPMCRGTVLLARSDRALPDLPQVLRARGFEVREIVAYHTIAEARGHLARVRAMLASAQPVAVLFHSPSAVDGMLGAIEPALVARASIHVIGGSTLRAARQAFGASADVSLIEEEAEHVAHR